MTLRRILTTLGLGATLAISNGFALTITQTFSSGPQGVDVNPSSVLTFNNFLSAGAPVGSTLTSVTLRALINETATEIDFINTTGSSQDFFSNLTTQFATSNTATLNPTDRGLVNAGGGAGAVGGTASSVHTVYNVGDGFNTINILNNQDICFVPTTGPGCTAATAAQLALVVAGPAVWDSGTINASSLAPYNTTGSFTWDYRTLTAETIIAGVNANYTGTTSGSFTVVYNYNGPTSGVPEPTTMALLGSALVGLGLIRRRVRS